MADILSLGKARKERETRAREQRAVENRVNHGRTKAQKQAGRAEEARRLARLDGHRRDPADTARDD